MKRHMNSVEKLVAMVIIDIFIDWLIQLITRRCSRCSGALAPSSGILVRNRCHYTTGL